MESVLFVHCALFEHAFELSELLCFESGSWSRTCQSGVMFGVHMQAATYAVKTIFVTRIAHFPLEKYGMRRNLWG